MKYGREGRKSKCWSEHSPVEGREPNATYSASSDSPDFISDSNSNSDGMSEYERNRARNIERNNARLRSLGLISSREERESNAAAWGRKASGVIPRAVGGIADLGSGIVRSSAGAKRRNAPVVARDASTSEKERRGHYREPARRSKRLRGEAAEVPSESRAYAGSPNAVVEEERVEEREERVRECREARLRAANAVAEAGHDAAATKNRTATYEHCLMRVQTMSERGLTNRVRAIERAAGKHCVVKMAIFKSCLQDEGLWDLAHEASGALERLKGLQPPPSE